MDVSILKNQLHKLIENTDDEQLLSEIYRKIDSEPDAAWWETLNEQQKARILESEKQYQKGEVVSNEAVLQKIQQWLQK